MRRVIDFSYERPSPAEVRLYGYEGVLFYTGDARPSTEYVSSMHQASLTVGFVQESLPSRSMGGRDSGVHDAVYADTRCDEVGYPEGASVAYVVSDSNADSPNASGQAIAAYASGVYDTSKRPVFWYGNRYAVDAAMIGAPYSLGCWVPSTWYSNDSDLLVQEANLTSYIAGTDVDTMQHNYGAWGGTEVAADARAFIQKGSDPSLGIWTTDGIYKRHVTGDEWEFDAFVNHGAHSPVLTLTDQWWDSIPTAALGHFTVTAA